MISPQEISEFKKVQWADAYSTGHQELDYAHQFLLSQFASAGVLLTHPEVDEKNSLF